MFAAKFTIEGVEFLISERVGDKGFDIALHLEEDLKTSEITFSNGKFEVKSSASKDIADILLHAFSSFMHHHLNKNIDNISTVNEVEIISEADPEAPNDMSLAGAMEDFSVAIV